MLREDAIVQVGLREDAKLDWSPRGKRCPGAMERGVGKHLHSQTREVQEGDWMLETFIYILTTRGANGSKWGIPASHCLEEVSDSS